MSKTVDALHLERLQSFEEKKILLKEKLVAREELQNELTAIAGFTTGGLSFDEIQYRSEKAEDMRSLELEISTLEKDTDEMVYFIQAGSSLVDYYNKRSILDGVVSRMDCKERYIVSTGLSDFKQKKVDPECDVCHVEYELLPSEAIYVCPSCGITMKAVVDSDKPTYREPPPEKNNYAYHRRGNMKIRMSVIQGTEKVDIPQALLDMIKAELQKMRSQVKLCIPLVIRFLDKHKEFKKFKNHAVRIMYLCTGVKPIQYTNEQVDNIMTIFDKVDSIYDDVKPESRTTFMSYFFVISKICQMLGYPYQHIPLLKSKDQLQKLDRIWRAICSELGGTKAGWKFISSF